MSLPLRDQLEYAQTFAEAAGTMDVSRVVELCRSLGWTEKDLSTQSIKDICGESVDCQTFLNMFKQQREKEMVEMPLPLMDHLKYTQTFAKAAGTMDVSRVVELCRSLGWTEKVLSTQNIKDLCGESVDYSTFLNIFNGQTEKEMVIAKFRRDFAKMDKDGNGEVTVQELTNYHQRVLTENEATEFIRDNDKNANDTMSFEEFLAAFGIKI